jgi:hypothetical protein
VCVWGGGVQNIGRAAVLSCACVLAGNVKEHERCVCLQADRLVAMEDFRLLLPQLSLLHPNRRGAEPPTPNQHMRSILSAYQVSRGGVHR